jgi:hypothetical protein
MTDLDPYICLTETCDRPNEMYKRSDDWLRHTRKHFLRWRCASKAHDNILFDTKDDYISHMKSHHRKTITDRQIAILADMCLHMIGPLFEICPLCAIKEQDAKGSLQEHIADHLQSLALESLPLIANDSEKINDVGRVEETDYETSIGTETNPQTYNRNITAFLNPASVTVPEARLAIKSHCHAGETPGQTRLIYVVQQPEDVDYSIDIPLEEPLGHLKITNIKFQIVYDPGSDDCILISRTRELLTLSNHQMPWHLERLDMDEIYTIQPGVWEIKPVIGTDVIGTDYLVEISLRERRYAISIAQPNSPLQDQRIEDSERLTKKQKLDVNLTMDVIPHASSSKMD